MIAQKGAEYLAAYSSMNTAVTLVTAPFTTVAGVLVVVAIARFGIIGKKSDEEVSHPDGGLRGV